MPRKKKQPEPLVIPAPPLPPEDPLKPHLARANLAFYANEFLRGPPQPPFNGRFMIANHHEQWADLVNRHRLLCINAARGHGKSYLLTLAYPIWMSDKFPGTKGFIFSGSQPQAEMIMAKITHEVETNPQLAHLLPPEYPKRKMWSTKQIKLANGSEIYARGYGTKVRGVHPQWIVADDILNDNDALSEIVRGKNVDYFFSAVRPTLLPGGQIIVIGTPFHDSDLYGVLRGKKEYHFAKFPAYVPDENGENKPLWPEYFPTSALESMRSEMGSVRFAREMLCNPKSDEASLFPSTLFTDKDVMQPMVKLGSSREFWKQAGVLSIFMGVDFALSTNVGADYTVIWCMGVDKFGNRWIVDIIRDKGLSFSAQKSMIVDAARKYNPAMIFCESNQSQRIFGDELIRTTDLPIKHFHTGEGKHSLEDGIPALRVLMENGKVRIPRGDAQSVEKTDAWIDEMRSMSFTNGRVFSTGTHDDTVMAFWICNNAIALGSFSFTFEEDEGDAAAYEEALAEEEAMADELDEEAEDGLVLGSSLPGRGRPKTINARLVEGLDLGAGDEAQWKRRDEGLRPYSEVRPQDGAPLGAAFGRK